MDRDTHMRQHTESVTILHAGGLRDGMLRPLEEECTAAGMASRPGTGMPAVPRSPIEQISTFSGHSISSELGQTDWRISPYETNPPSSEEETGGCFRHWVCHGLSRMHSSITCNSFIP